MLAGNSVEGLSWLDPDQSRPSQQEIDEELLRLEQEYQQTQYRRLRAACYPAIGDQLDALYHAGVFPTEMAAQIQAVKDQYPKP